VPLPPSRDQLSEYVGVYASVENPDAVDPIVIKLQGESLFANLYWPSGSLLVAEGDDLFRVQSTSRMIKSRRDDAGGVVGLT
jgi:hypothetical protein